ncbi:hypothetical protein OIU34_02510 [Pararhizobium sp. BT-229]|uniref:hypothetical protein n=1 Tax=Pararhizobium sp. BT-229 TaxID=2986923 RepID=UPI0021F7251F|nr:hypothetical protein [Pararhizobium sp. BT-229]MCV9960760.1 hypothetical protein [Pararhizobium sp. BT-229]
MRTPFPWAQSDSAPCLVFGKNLGVVDFNHPVAKFRNIEDARTVVRLIDIRDEMLATLRVDLRLLEHELTCREFSGVEDYIAPVRSAVERTKNAIAQAEGWT